MRFVKLLIFLYAIGTNQGFAQNGLGMYSLGNFVPQNAYYNPAYENGAKVVVGLPVISEMGVHVNNRFNYNQAFTKLENDSVRLDIDKVIASLKKKNLLLAELNVPLLYLSIHPNESPLSYRFFVNDRINIRGQYQKALIKAVWKGPSNLVGNELRLRKSALSSSYFREFGVGASTSLANDEIRVGANLKIIQGIANIKTLFNMDADLQIDKLRYSYGIDLEGAGINATGLDGVPSASYLLANKNIGVAIDVGGTWQYNNVLQFSASINDLGFVRWKEESQNFLFKDSTFVYNGVNFSNKGNIVTGIDSLVQALTPEESTSPYSAMLGTRTVVSGSLQFSPTNRVIVTMMNKFLVGKLKSAFSVSYVRQLNASITMSGSLVKLPQQWPRPGLAMSLAAGPVQYYIGSDNLAGFLNVPGMRVLDFKMGINLLIGAPKSKNQEHLPPAHRSKPKFSTNGQGVDYPTDPRLKKPTVFREKDIYKIISKKKQPKNWNNWFKRSKKEN